MPAKLLKQSKYAPNVTTGIVFCLAHAGVQGSQWRLHAKTGNDYAIIIRCELV